jgi:hypothetical protein
MKPVNFLNLGMENTMSDTFENKQTLNDLLNAIENYDRDDKKGLALIISKAKSVMSSSSENKPCEKSYHAYSTKLISAAINGQDLPSYPPDLIYSRSSNLLKQLIREVVISFDPMISCKNKAAIYAWDRVKLSSNLVDLRNNLTMYIKIIREIQDNDIQDLVDDIDRLDKEVRVLKDYKRIQEELFSIVFKDDAEQKLLSDIETAKLVHGLTDDEAITMFGCTRRKLSTLRSKYNLEVTMLVDGKIVSNKPKL